jgi:hypothetical protein
MGEYAMNLDKKLNLFLTERRKTTRAEMTKATRQLRMDKAKDTGIELYPDFTKFMATYLNSLDSKDLAQYRTISRDKAVQLIQAIASSNEMAQAVLDKMHLDAEHFVSRFWTKMQMKPAIQDAIVMLMKGEKGVTVTTPAKEAEVVDEETKPKEHKCEQCGKDMGNEWILGPVCGKCVRANHATVTGKASTAQKKKAALRTHVNEGLMNKIKSWFGSEDKEKTGSEYFEDRMDALGKSIGCIDSYVSFEEEMISFTFKKPDNMNMQFIKNKVELIRKKLTGSFYEKLKFYYDVGKDEINIIASPLGIKPDGMKLVK